MSDSARAAAVGDIDAENWLRGRFRLACERGALDATVTLAPTNPPRVQYLDVQRRRRHQPVAPGLDALRARRSLSLPL